MQHLFSILYFTEKRAGELRFEGDLTPGVIEFLQLFGTVHDGGIAMVGVQQATAALKARVAAFAEKYSREIPQINAFAKVIRDLREGENFLIQPAENLSTSERLRYEQDLALFNGTATPEEVASQAAFFAPVLAAYEIHTPRTDKHLLIGNPVRDERICRFCRGTTRTGATFKSDAHAIPAALGNRYLKLADECDGCNGYFGREIEPHLIALLDVPRVMQGIRGRGKNGGLPEIPLKNGTMFHDGERVVIECQSDPLEHGPDGLVIELAGATAIVPEKCYRALAKIALSVIDEGELAHLSETVEWVRHGRLPEGRSLPKMAATIHASAPNPCAQITLYIRNSGPSRLPHLVGEFRLGGHVYVFALPFSARDGDDLAFFGDPEFMAAFHHYASSAQWDSQDWSSTEAIGGAQRVRLGQAPR